MTGDQLVRPLNAPDGVPQSPGTQPGVSSAVFLGRYVIVFGTAGGVFLYVGAPAHGNPPVEWMSTGTKDPYGNTLPTAGIASFGGTTGVFMLNGNLNYTAAAGTVNTEAVASPFGSGAAIQVTGDMSLVDNLKVGGIISATGGSNSVPTIIETDTWQSPSPPTGFTGTLRYRMTPDQQVDVECFLAVANTVAAGTVTLITLPTNYTPATTARGPVGWFPNGTPTLAQLTATSQQRWSANPAGTFTVQAFVGGAAGSGITELSFTIRYPLT